MQAPPLRLLYDDSIFRAFIARVTGDVALHPYADPLSSINIHDAEHGQELGWHFDNSSFAITLLIQKPQAAGHFEYVKDLRNADANEMNYPGVAALLHGDVTPGRRRWSRVHWYYFGAAIPSTACPRMKAR